MAVNLREYAAQVVAHAEKLQFYLDSKDEKLGFGIDIAPRTFPLELQESRIALMSACDTMRDLVDGAESMMTQFPFIAVHDIGALKIFYHYQLWKLVPAEGTISLEDLAKLVKLDVHRLAAFMRQLINRRIFLEPEPNRIAHSTASFLVARNDSLQSWIAACTDDILEAVSAYPQTYDPHGLTMDPKLSPYNIARGDTSMSGMALVLSDKERGPRYSKGLGWVAKSETGANDAILNAYSWDQSKLIVDVSKVKPGCLSQLIRCRLEEVMAISVAPWPGDIPMCTVSFKILPLKHLISRLQRI